MGAIAAVFATASLAGGTLSLRLHYPMVCGRPGAGPVVVRLPAAARVAGLQARVSGRRRPASLAGAVVTIRLPPPPEVTCMSIAEGVLPVTLTRLRIPPGTYTLHARVNTHAFAARLRVP